MSGTFNPFEKHVSKPEPIQAQPEAESTGSSQPNRSRQPSLIHKNHQKAKPP
jgi:hypothetical protein